MLSSRGASAWRAEASNESEADGHMLHVMRAQMARGADPETRSQVLEILDSAQSLGLKVLRMWAFGEGPLQYNSLQRYPGAHTADGVSHVQAALHTHWAACKTCH